MFAVRRADIEGFAGDLEAKGRARATVTRRLSAIAGFYKYAVEEELLDRSPAAHVRRPRIDYESHAVALDRNELGALLVAAGLGSLAGHALISLFALNGLPVSEATGADIEHPGLERGHRTLTVTRKGGKVVTVPLAPRTARAIDLAIGEHTDGPLFLAADGRRLDRHGAGRIVLRTAAAPGSPRRSRPTRCGTRSSPPVWMPGCRSAMSRRQPPMRTRGRRCGMTVAAAAWTGTRPTSSPPTSQELHGKGVPAGNAPPDGDSQRQAELRAAADACYHHAAVTHRDLSANANSRSHRPPRRPMTAPTAVPDRPLWCRIARALSQVLACLA